jgi:hypothetical protein
VLTHIPTYASSALAQWKSYLLLIIFALYVISLSLAQAPGSRTTSQQQSQQSAATAAAAQAAAVVRGAAAAAAQAADGRQGTNWQ